ncbi:Lrp/AsnC ligand binding domain-containing protein [Undibacterium flavidum]|uniref:Lrp/AsnC ligand binding domain-containing protein n=1 Tax=Undibacterium flavidum TaxID=2762297 RepID=UPI0038B62F1F
MIAFEQCKPKLHGVQLKCEQKEWGIKSKDSLCSLAKRHEIIKLYTVSGRYDLCAKLSTESTHELDAVIDKIHLIKGGWIRFRRFCCRLNWIGRNRVTSI